MNMVPSLAALPVQRSVRICPERLMEAEAEVPDDDDRWPPIADTLKRLHAIGRRSVRIVDADCGPGDLLLHAVRHARALGFTAIEACGIDDVLSLVEQGRSAAAALHDPAIGITFESSDLIAMLAKESEFPADIILSCREPGCPVQIARAVAAAGRTVISHAGAA